VAGAVSPEGGALFCHGRTALPDGPPQHAGALHELGSVSKTFTGLLLAEMAARGEVGYDAPVAGYLPAHARPSGATGRQVTLLDLATHTAGLPRVPAHVYLAVLRSGNTDPYARYTAERLYRTTARLRPRGHRGEFHYSNLGFGLLGQALANAGGSTYPALLAARVLTPLGMRGSTAEPSATADAATGHRRGVPVAGWRFAALAGAGAVRSHGTDLLAYLDALVRPGETPIAEALRAVQTPKHRRRNGDHICLAWFRREVDGIPLLWHEGATAGFTSFVGISPATGVGIFVLANTKAVRGQPALKAARRAFKDLMVRSNGG
jgi:CubicO group peptidase (beta-lactamase class C family)